MGLRDFEDEQHTLKKTSNGIESKVSTSGKESMSEIEKLQKTVTTSFTLQLGKRDKLIELQQSFLLKDLAVISKAQDLLTNEELEKTQTKTGEEESTLSNKKRKEHDALISQLREKDEQIEKLQQRLKEMGQTKVKDQKEDNLEGVIPAGDTVFLLRGSSQPQFFNWEKYGLSLSAPEGILPPSETCEVTITALAGGEFKFPKVSELVSAVYVISVSKPLLRPLTVNIQHCVSLKTLGQCKSLQFVRAPLINGTLPYQFQVLPGGHFIPGNQYGSISCTDFSLLGIYLELESNEDNEDSEEGSTSDDNSDEDTSENDQLSQELELKESDVKIDDMVLEVQKTETKSENLEDDEVKHKPLPKRNTTVGRSQNASTKPTEKADILYYCKVYYEETDDLENKWQIMFTVVKCLNALQQYIKQCYPRAEEGQKIDLDLSIQNDIEFDIQKYHHEIPQGWMIMPRTQPLRLSCTAIKIFGTTGYPEPPTCFVDVCAYQEPETAKVLHYCVPILGIELKIAVYINLFLRQKPLKLMMQGLAVPCPMSYKAHPGASVQQNTMEEDIVQLSTIMMKLISRKQSQEISEEEPPIITTGYRLEEIKGIIKNVLTRWYSLLSKVLTKSLKKIAADMYSHGLITESVNETPEFQEIMSEFQSGVDLIPNYQRLVKHCELFLQTLIDQRGPPKEAAINIAEEWTDNIKRKLDITIEFNIIV